jgi:hypothetical protein
MSVAHGASKYLGTRPFVTEVVFLAIVMAPTMGVPHSRLGLHTVIHCAMLPICLGFHQALGRPGRSQVEKPSSEEAIPTSGAL